VVRRSGGIIMKLKKGKRYAWYINNYENKMKNGLFTGNFDKNNNSILMTKNGEVWSIPVKDLIEVKNK
jgi:hypothetical protein